MDERRDYEGLRAIIREEQHAAMHEWASSAEAREMVCRGIKSYQEENRNIPCFQRCDRMDAAQKDIKGLARTLYGDDGRSGLVSIVQCLESRFIVIWAVLVILLGAVVGSYFRG